MSEYKVRGNSFKADVLREFSNISNLSNFTPLDIADKLGGGDAKVAVVLHGLWKDGLLGKVGRGKFKFDTSKNEIVDSGDKVIVREVSKNSVVSEPVKNTVKETPVEKEPTKTKDIKIYDPRSFVAAAASIFYDALKSKGIFKSIDIEYKTDYDYGFKYPKSFYGHIFIENHDVLVEICPYYQSWATRDEITFYVNCKTINTPVKISYSEEKNFSTPFFKNSYDDTKYSWDKAKEYANKFLSYLPNMLDGLKDKIKKDLSVFSGDTNDMELLGNFLRKATGELDRLFKNSGFSSVNMPGFGYHEDKFAIFLENKEKIYNQTVKYSIDIGFKENKDTGLLTENAKMNEVGCLLVAGEGV